MNLGFKERFKELILSGSKIHTIRTDATDRWRKGMKIHFATGIRTKNYNCFKEGVCTGVQKIEFKWVKYHDGNLMYPTIFIDGIELQHNLIMDNFDTDKRLHLSQNDGFGTLIEFFEWEAWYRKDFTGKIIHWTDKKY